MLVTFNVIIIINIYFSLTTSGKMTEANAIIQHFKAPTNLGKDTP